MVKETKKTRRERAKPILERMKKDPEFNKKVMKEVVKFMRMVK